VSAALERFYAGLEPLFAEATARYPWWPCREGCSKCCHLASFAVSRAEAAYVLSAVRELDRDTRRRVARRARALVSRVRREQGYGPWNSLIDRYLGVEFECPLLFQDACLVYWARPTICRLYGYSMFGPEGDQYWCATVAEALAAHQGEGVQALNFNAVVEGARGVLAGPRKPLVAWLEESL
jgi:Fe-S-cluster containining protein